jgi:hypothetical protein
VRVVRVVRREAGPSSRATRWPMIDGRWRQVGGCGLVAGPLLRGAACRESGHATMRTVVDAHRGVLRLLHEAGGVLHTERDARVALRLGEVGEELAREAEHHLVDLDPHDLPQVGVPARPRGGGISGGGSCRGRAGSNARRGPAATCTRREGSSSRA